MARDCSTELREFFVTALKADPAVAALVGAEVYGPKAKLKPNWPFLRFDNFLAVPDYDGCGDDASACTGTLHAFVKGPDERQCRDLGNQAIRVLDGLSGEIAPGPPAIFLRETLWTSTQVLGDTAEANGWHGVIKLRSLLSVD